MKVVAEWHPQEMPSLIVIRVARLLSRRVDEGLAELGLTSSQLPVLASLKGGLKMTQRELADCAGVAQPSMTQLLSRMERDDLIQRTTSPTDRRASLIVLTQHAEQKLEPGREELRRLDEHICSVLTEKECKSLITLLKKLVLHAEIEL